MITKEEMVDVYNPITFSKTGEVITKTKAHKEGIWHSSIHLIIVDKDRIKTLFQQRATDKSLYPNMWDIAVGGHISTGETDYEAVRRELQEELGINPFGLDIRFIKQYKEELFSNGINNKEIVSIFMLLNNIKLEEIRLQQEEVKDIKWVTKMEMESLINNKLVIPHNEEYKILRKVLK